MKLTPFRLFTSLRTQLALFGIAVALATCGVLGWTAYRETREIIVSNAKRTVGIVATARKESLVRILKNYTERSGNFLSLAHERCNQPSTTEMSFSCVRDRLLEFVKFNGAESALAVFSGKEIVVGEGRTLTIFRGAKWPQSQLAQFKIDSDGHSYFVIRGSDKSGFQLFIKFNTNKLAGLFQDRTGLGNSGETFLTDGQGMFLTQSRYPSHSGHSHPISARPMVSCLSGEEQEVLDPDYREVAVIHGFRFVPEIGGGCIMAHIDQAEAFAPVKALRSHAIRIALSVALLAVLVSLAISYFLVRPFRLLTRSVHALRDGKLDTQIPAIGTSEMRAFAGTLGAMARSLKQSQKDLSDRENKFRSIFECSHDAILIVDPVKNAILDANPSACKLLKFERTELLSTPVSRIHATDMPQLLTFATSVVEKGHGWTDELTCTDRDGVAICCEISASRVKPQGDRTILAIVRDISERKAAEIKIKEQAEKLARSNADLERFAAVAAHDLQEPLRTVAMFCSLLHGRATGKLDAECEEYMQFIADGAKRMQRLVRDLLGYARVESGAKVPQIVEVSSIIQQAVANLRSAISDCEADITCESSSAFVYGDSTLLVQLIQNLVGNSIKYRRKDVSPRVHLSATRDGDLWKIKIQDNGIGIPKEHLDQVFDIFRRLHSRQEYEGTGIGLATCRKIVERYGGKIWVESEPGIGSCFYFTIRAAKAVASKELAGAKVASEAQYF